MKLTAREIWLRQQREAKLKAAVICWSTGGQKFFDVDPVEPGTRSRGRVLSPGEAVPTPRPQPRGHPRDDKQEDMVK